MNQEYVYQTKNIERQSHNMPYYSNVGHDFDQRFDNRYQTEQVYTTQHQDDFDRGSKRNLKSSQRKSFVQYEPYNKSIHHKTYEGANYDSRYEVPRYEEKRSQSTFQNRPSTLVKTTQAPIQSYAYNQYVDEVPVSRKSIKEDLTYNKIKTENDEMRKELHELRKMQYGWYGKNPKVVKKEVIVEKHFFETEINNLRKELTTINNERNTLVSQVTQLQEENNRLRAELEKHLGNRQKSQVDIQNVEKQYRERIGALEDKLRLLENERRKLNNDLQRERQEKSQINTSAFEQHTRKLTSQAKNLELNAQQKEEELKRLELQNQEYLRTIEKLHQELEDQKQGMNFGDDNLLKTDEIIAMYKKKFEEKNLENDNLRNQLENLKNEMHSIRLRSNEIEINKTYVQTAPQNDNLLSEIEHLRGQEEFWKQENSRLKDIIAHSKSTENRTVIREVHSSNNVGNAYGLSSKEIEDLALRNVALELEVKRLVDEKNLNTGFSNYGETKVYKKVSQIGDNIPVRVSSYGNSSNLQYV